MGHVLKVINNEKKKLTASEAIDTYRWALEEQPSNFSAAL